MTFGVRSLRDPGATVSAAEAMAIAAAHWGIGGEPTALPAEVDQNFQIASASGEYLLKIVPADEPEAMTDLVTAAIVHLDGRLSDVAVQRVLPTGAGESLARFQDSAGAPRRARLTTFLPGRTLRSVAVDGDRRRQIGSALAALALALRDFDHPAADRELSWDIRHAARMQGMLDELPETEKRHRLRAALVAFGRDTVPRLTPLPVQVVHNDLSKDNAVLLPDGRIGVIDFGDIVRTQRVNDVAVAMADHVGDGSEPFAPALDLLEGFLAVGSLGPAEIDLLYELVRIRVVTRVVGGEWRAARFPENEAYLTRHVERLTAVLANLPEQPTPNDAARLAEFAARAAR